MSIIEVEKNITEYINNHNSLTHSELKEQIRKFSNGTSYSNLIAPALVKNGIEPINQDKIDKYVKIYEKYIDKLDIVKFIPASGAATRMFKDLISFYNESEMNTFDELFKNKESHKSVFFFFKNIKKFAFYNDLTKLLISKGLDYEYLLEHDIKKLLSLFLFENGLNYSNLPKAVLPFHCYSGDNWTPIDEHILETIRYVKNGSSKGKIHFTISKEHKSYFDDVVSNNKYFKEDLVEITYSSQNPETDTIAVDLNNSPICDEEDGLIFRPGGHGALLENLNKIDADIIFIKNIDNVIYNSKIEETIKFKKYLGGKLLDVKEIVHRLFSQLNDNQTIGSLEEIILICEHKLNFVKPEGFENLEFNHKLEFLNKFLLRPIRIGGMISSDENPGGGPFWVKNKNNQISLQVVETPQINMNDETTKNVFEKAKYFSPADFACWVKDPYGKKYNLINFRDDEAYFITQKTYNGKPIKALELPGLWNGSMADWITVFVEIPADTFNPVKSVNNLLELNHLSS